MPELAEYGIAVLALGSMTVLVRDVLKYRNKHRNDDSMAIVIENNTRALEHVRNCVLSLHEFLAGTLARQDQKLEELLSRARDGK